MRRLAQLVLLLLAVTGVSAENNFLTIYPQMRSIATSAPLYLSAFARGGKELEVLLVGISRADYEKYNVDPWSRSYQQILAKAKYKESNAAFKAKFKAKTGANYLQLKHGVKPGYYLIVAKLDGDTVAKSTVLVSDIGIIAKQSETELLIQTVSLVTGKSRGATDVTVSSPAGGESKSLKQVTCIHLTRQAHLQCKLFYRMVCCAQKAKRRRHTRGAGQYFGRIPCHASRRQSGEEGHGESRRMGQMQRYIQSST